MLKKLKTILTSIDKKRALQAILWTIIVFGPLAVATKTGFALFIFTCVLILGGINEPVRKGVLEWLKGE